MTVQIDIDDKQWAEARTLAEELKIDYNKVLIKAFRSILRNLRREKLKTMNIAEKEEQHRGSYEKHPVGPDEFYVDEERLIEAWKEL